jgi:hypothetical protein
MLYEAPDPYGIGTVKVQSHIKSSKLPRSAILHPHVFPTPPAPPAPGIPDPPAPKIPESPGIPAPPAA